MHGGEGTDWLQVRNVTCMLSATPSELNDVPTELVSEDSLQVVATAYIDL